MKNLKLFSVIISVLLIFSSCNIINIDNFKASDLTHSDCKNTKDNMFGTETINFKATDINNLKVIHKNTIFNCCPEKLKVETSLESNSIVLNEFSTKNLCSCICPYDLEYTIGRLQYGKYSVAIQFDGSEYSKFTIDYNPNTDTTIIIER